MQEMKEMTDHEQQMKPKVWYFQLWLQWKLSSWVYQKHFVTNYVLLFE